MNALPIDVAVPDQPSPFDVPTMSHIARRKLGELVADGHQVCGVMIERATAEGVQRGAVSVGGLVVWWKPSA